jgi:hypothetical protein
MIMIALVVTLLCTAAPQPKLVKAKPSPEATFKQRWLALHFRELAK